MTKQIYTGWLKLIKNGVEPDYEDVLAVPYSNKEHSYSLWDENETSYLAALIRSHMIQFGNYLSIQYWTMDQPIENDRVRDTFIEEFYGIGRVRYNMHWSEDTGYLWTDEDLMVGGHDLLEELKSHVGKYLYMEIGYSKEAKVKE